MNQLAEELGANNTHFVNPHGLHDGNHYTTAYDLALIASCAMQNEDFCNIVSAQSAVIANDGFEYKRVLKNKNKLLERYEFANGVKTGYTKKAGRCFVGGAKMNGMQLIAVVLNCSPMFENAQSMLEFGFSRYTMTNIIPKNKVFGAVFDKGVPTYYQCESGFSYPLTRDEVGMLKKDITLDESDSRVKVWLGDKLIFDCKLTKY